MGVDISVIFAAQPITVEQVVQASIAQAHVLHVVHVVVGVAPEDWGEKPFFALWADTEFDVQALCSELSLVVSPICITWKSEHGGVGGYRIVVNGQEVENDDSSDENYMLLPSYGLERAFSLEVNYSSEADERLYFPEVLLDEALNCYRVIFPRGEVEQLSGNIITQLLEGDIEDTEPVLP